jgi:hypothetical protein
MKRYLAVLFFGFLFTLEARAELLVDNDNSLKSDTQICYGTLNGALNGFAQQSYIPGYPAEFFRRSLTVEKCNNLINKRNLVKITDQSSLNSLSASQTKL